MARLSIRLDIGSGVPLGALSAAVHDISAVLDLGLRVDAVVARNEAQREVERLWSEQPGQLYEQSLRLNERTAQQVRRLLDQRQEADRFRDRLEGAPPEIWWEEWFLAQRRWRGKRPYRYMPPPMLWAPLGAAVPELSDVAPDLYARLVAEETSRHLPTVPAVDSLTYQNPLEVVLLVLAVATGAGFKFGTFTELAKLIRDWSAERRRAQVGVREANAKVERELAEAERVRAETREIHARASRSELETELLRRFAAQTARLSELEEAGVTSRELRAIAQLTAAEVDVELTDDES